MDALQPQRYWHDELFFKLPDVSEPERVFVERPVLKQNVIIKHVEFNLSD